MRYRIQSPLKRTVHTVYWFPLAAIIWTWGITAAAPTWLRVLSVILSAGVGVWAARWIDRENNDSY